MGYAAFMGADIQKIAECAGPYKKGHQKLSEVMKNGKMAGLAVEWKNETDDAECNSDSGGYKNNFPNVQTNNTSRIKILIIVKLSKITIWSIAWHIILPLLCIITLNGRNVKVLLQHMVQKFMEVEQNPARKKVLTFSRLVIK